MDFSRNEAAAISSRTFIIALHYLSTNRPMPIAADKNQSLLILYPFLRIGERSQFLTFPGWKNSRPRLWWQT